MKGKFELANDGTIFLDEISDMSPLAQVKVLRVLEYGEFERLGSERMLKTDARIICATNVSLRDRVRQGKFREDLYHRLNGLTILIPALRDRREELPGLIANELKVSALRMGKKITAIHPAAMDRLLRHDWRGNLRELSHTVRTMTLFCDGDVIMPEHVHFPPDLEPLETSANASDKNAARAHYDYNGGDLSLASAVKRHVRFVYKEASQNQRRTAKILGISRATLSRHLRGLDQK
jgi:DNA-binding NtrC family response regulator